MISRRKISITAGVVVIILLATWGLSLLAPKNTDQQATDESTPSSLTVKGLDDSKYLFSVATQTAIITEISSYLALDNINTSKMEGAVRQESYTQEETDNTTITTLLIDIPVIKRTYKVISSASGSPDGDNSLYIRCPSKNELIYDTFDCKDDSNA